MSTEAARQKMDLFLLLNPEPVANAYAPDIQRVMPHLKDRIAMFRWWEMELIRRGLPFVTINGATWDARHTEAETAVRNLIGPY